MDFRIHKAHRATIKLPDPYFLENPVSRFRFQFSESKEAFSKNLEKLRLESGDSIKVRSDHRLRIVSIRCADTFIQKLKIKLKCCLDLNQKITREPQDQSCRKSLFLP